MDAVRRIIYEDIELAYKAGLIGSETVDSVMRAIPSYILSGDGMLKKLDGYGYFSADLIVHFLGNSIGINPREANSFLGFPSTIYSKVSGGARVHNLRAIEEESLPKILGDLRDIIVEAINDNLKGYVAIHTRVRRVIYEETDALEYILGEEVPGTMDLLKEKFDEGKIDSWYLIQMRDHLIEIDKHLKESIPEEERFTFSLQAFHEDGEEFEVNDNDEVAIMFQIMLTTTSIFHSVNYFGCVLKDDDVAYLTKMFDKVRDG